MKIYADKLLNPFHKELFQSTSRILLVRGGMNAGKSYSIADKIILASNLYPHLKVNVLIVRKTLTSARTSTISILETRAKAWKKKYRLNATTCYMYLGDNVEIVTKGLDEKGAIDRVHSMTDIDIIWLNEATELRENDFWIIQTRLRGGQLPFAQTIADFNPVPKSHWIYQRCYATDDIQCQKLLYTIDQNPWASKEEIEALDSLKVQNEDMYNKFRNGEWGSLDGYIYDWFQVPKIPEISFDEIFCGLDFGFSNSSTAIVKIYRKGDEYWLEELLYDKGMTNQDIVSRLKADTRFDMDLKIFYDPAEPKSGEEMRRLGLNMHPASKGQGSVNAGIDYIKRLKVNYTADSENIRHEVENYVWKKDKYGMKINEPVKFNDHAMDAVRYGIFSNAEMNNQKPRIWGLI